MQVFLLEGTMVQKPLFSELNEDHSTQSDSVHSSCAATRTKMAYAKPQLFAYGDLRSLTFGASPGTGESGNAFTTAQLP